MDFELSQPSIFPDETEVGAYLAAQVPDRTKAPQGEPVNKQEVEDGKVNFTGLVADLSYYAGAEVEEDVWRYVHFTPGTPGVDIAVSTDDNETITGDWAFGGKVGFFGKAAIAQPEKTDDIKDALIALGLLETGGATPLDLDEGKLTCGEADINGDLNHDGTKVGFFGTAPAAQPDIKPAAEATAKEICEALVTLGLVK